MQWDKNIEILWNVPDFLKVLKDDYSKEFAMAEFSSLKSLSPFSSGVSRIPENYKKRILAIEFVCKNRILDAGCGMGQWSYCLSALNNYVIGVDQSEHRLSIAKYLNRNCKNAEFILCNLEDILAKDGEFDAIFCYGVFMFTDMFKTLCEFKRVLSENGVCFLNFNNVGHYVHRILYYTTEAKNQELAMQAQKMVSNYYQGFYKSSLMTLEVFKALCEKVGFEVIYYGYDGESAELPFYRKEFYNFPYVTEVLIKHKDY